VLNKIDALRQKIWHKLRGIPEAKELNATVEKGEKVTEQQLNLLVPYLEAAMKEDAGFAAEIRQLAIEINQEINNDFGQITQVNRDSSTGYQTKTGPNNTNFFGGQHHHH
jgi:hypothetical protein